MKKRTKEESAASMREYRARKRAQLITTVTPVTPITHVTPTPVIATPAPPCPNCERLAAEIARLTTDNAEALRQHVISDKTNRINTFGRNPSIGVARI